MTYKCPVKGQQLDKAERRYPLALKMAPKGSQASSRARKGKEADSVLRSLEGTLP